MTTNQTSDPVIFALELFASACELVFWCLLLYLAIKLYKEGP